MFRLLLSLFAITLLFNRADAQSSTTATSRLTFQDLSASEAQYLKESTEVNDFARNLAALKTAFAEQNASQIVANESYLLLAMRMEADQLSAKTTSSNQSHPDAEAAKTRLAKMNSTLEAFKSHAFDPAKPEAAARDFAKLDEFFIIMQTELKATGSK